MKNTDCQHRQHVITNCKDIQTQSCLICGVILYQWNLKSGKEIKALKSNPRKK